MKKIRYEVQEWCQQLEWQPVTSFWAVSGTQISLWPNDPTRFRLVRIEEVNGIGHRITDNPRSAEDIHD
jgi:hypothetical protein